LEKVRALLERDLEVGANLITSEMGKVIGESRSEINKCLAMISYYCSNAQEYLEDKSIKTAHQSSYVTYRPQGIILGIMPWNFPFWQVLRFAIPTLLTGNAVIVKHAPNVQGCQNFMQQIFDEAAKGVSPFHTLLIDVKKVESIIADQRIRGISFTGSESVGRAVAQLAAKNLKRAVLELGGSDPYLVLSDANLEIAVKACVSSRFINNGQSCVAAKRWIISKEIIGDFEELAIEEIKKLKTGNPNNLESQLGPMARKDLKENLLRQLARSIEKGASKLYEGNLEKEVEAKGFYTPPVLLKNVRPGHASFDEEVFGPIASIIEAKNEDEAIALANKSLFGLGGAIFSQDIEKAEHLAKYKLDTGGVFINDFYKSVPQLPFGGVKNSGIGRELSKEALYEFSNVKTIAIP
jgi:succinate-semialdehyde dehydrogenase/glutarate-semialdehyde dehydrogenase